MRYTDLRTMPRPTGRMYHGPGHARSRYGLSLYHRTNSLRGIRKAAKLGYDWIDLDVRELLDGEFVASHSDDAMGKEGFRGPGVPRRVLSRLRWRAVRLLRRRDGTRIQRLLTLLLECKRVGIGGALDIKTPLTMVDADRLTLLANLAGAKVYAKYDPAKPALARSAERLHHRGWWTRPNGSGEFRRPGLSGCESVTASRDAERAVP